MPSSVLEPAILANVVTLRLTSRHAQPLDLVSFSEQLHAAWDNVHEDLLGLSTLPEDWDGDGAAAPLREAIRATATVLDILENIQTIPPPTRLIATGSGSVCLEWLGPDESTKLEVRDENTLRHARVIRGSRSADIVLLSVADLTEYIVRAYDE